MLKPRPWLLVYSSNGIFCDHLEFILEMTVMHLSSNKMIKMWEIVYNLVALFVNNYEKHCRNPWLMTRKRGIFLNVNVFALYKNFACNKKEFIGKKVLIDITSW